MLDPGQRCFWGSRQVGRWAGGRRHTPHTSQLRPAQTRASPRAARTGAVPWLDRAGAKTSSPCIGSVLPVATGAASVTTLMRAQPVSDTPAPPRHWRVPGWQAGLGGRPAGHTNCLTAHLPLRVPPHRPLHCNCHCQRAACLSFALPSPVSCPVATPLPPLYRLRSCGRCHGDAQPHLHRGVVEPAATSRLQHRCSAHHAGASSPARSRLS